MEQSNRWHGLRSMLHTIPESKGEVASQVPVNVCCVLGEAVDDAASGCGVIE